MIFLLPPKLDGGERRRIVVDYVVCRVSVLSAVLPS